MELLQPRSSAFTGVPLGGRRSRRLLGRSTATLLRGGAVERQGSDSQGAALRADEQRGESRRRRQGVLLLPRRHAHMKSLYKSPQRAYPYADLVDTNRRRTRQDFEYELIDTGVFDDDRYFDVFVEYAKAAPEDILIRLSVCNRAGEAASLHVLPTLWFRRTWSSADDSPRPLLRRGAGYAETSVIAATHPELGERLLHCEGAVPLLFTENETNHERLFGGRNRTRHVKDGINDFVVLGHEHAVNPEQVGTKAAAHYELTVPAGETRVVRLRLTDATPDAQPGGHTGGNPFGGAFDATVAARLQEADEFYQSITPPAVDEDGARVMRQALAGMLWSKQYYYFDADRWLDEHRAGVGGNRTVRNAEWFHMINDDVISMPDKWEYPWYAAWDLAFHAAALSIVDLDFAKRQLDLMLGTLYLHPSGQ